MKFDLTMIKRGAFVLCGTALVALALIASASAQSPNPVTTQPYPVTTQNSSGIIASTGTFQSIWAAVSAPRRRAACFVQNNSASPMYVYFGAVADATTPTSVKLTAGQFVTCNIGGTAQQDQVSITGTAGETFYAGQN